MHRTPKYVQVYNQILLMIKRSQFLPGSKLPSEEKLTSDFQIIADYFVQLSKNKDYVPKDKIIRHTDSFLKLSTNSG